MKEMESREKDCMEFFTIEGGEEERHERNGK